MKKKIALAFLVLLTILIVVLVVMFVTDVLFQVFTHPRNVLDFAGCLAILFLFFKAIDWSVNQLDK